MVENGDLGGVAQLEGVWNNCGDRLIALLTRFYFLGLRTTRALTPVYPGKWAHLKEYIVATPAPE